jgi:hypothetical protein
MVGQVSRLPGGRVENSKSEIRNLKSEMGGAGNPKSEIRIGRAGGIPNSSFRIPNSNEKPRSEERGGEAIRMVRQSNSGNDRGMKGS